MAVNIYQIEPKLGEGIYLARDVAKILRIDYAKTYRWMVGYWNNHGLEENTQYTFGPQGNRAINFLSLIEFYTFFTLREKGLSTLEIKKLHHQLSSLLQTSYPFATQDFYFESKGKKKAVYYEYLNNLIKFDRKYQYSLRLIEVFLQKVQFGEDHLATRFFPLGSERNVVVDPQHQFGQPTISGTNIKTQTLYSLYKGGESLEDISNLYKLSIDKVRDAIDFQNAA